MDIDIFRRLGLYGFGVCLGMIILYVFFGDKAFRCSYLPNERVLDEVRHKPKHYNPDFLIQLKQLQKDTLFLKNEVLNKANIVFDERVREKPCGYYQMVYQNNRYHFKKCESWVQFIKIDHFLKTK